MMDEIIAALTNWSSGHEGRSWKMESDRGAGMEFINIRLEDGHLGVERMAAVVVIQQSIHNELLSEVQQAIRSLALHKGDPI